MLLENILDNFPKLSYDFNMKIFITSGGTKIPIDKVRNITNMSKGTFGSKIATESLRAGHDVYFYRAEDSKSPTQHVINLVEKFSQEDVYSLIEEASKLI